jgi:hypothetical protein
MLINCCHQLYIIIFFWGGGCRKEISTNNWNTLHFALVQYETPFPLRYPTVKCNTNASPNSRHYWHTACGNYRYQLCHHRAPPNTRFGVGCGAGVGSRALHNILRARKNCLLLSGSCPCQGLPNKYQFSEKSSLMCRSLYMQWVLEVTRAHILCASGITEWRVSSLLCTRSLH